jgi:hypothetical protein
MWAVYSHAKIVHRLLVVMTVPHTGERLVIFEVKTGKAASLQARSGLGGSRKLRFPDFMTTAQDGVKVVSLTHRPPLPPGNTPGAHFC